MSSYIPISGRALVVFTVALHALSGTPEILRTVLPVLLLGSLYCFVYVANLERELGRRVSAAA